MTKIDIYGLKQNSEAGQFWRIKVAHLKFRIATAWRLIKIISRLKISFY